MTTAMIDATPIVQRGDTYKLLAACFYEPEKQLFLEEKVCHNLAHLLLQASPEGAEAAEQMLLSLETYDQQQLSIDHAALFVGPFELLAAPYASVWREEHRLVMGDSTMNVKRFYQEAELQADANEPPDHVAIMLEFMSYLCRKEAEALTLSATGDAEKYYDLQKRFFTEALIPWITDFCKAIASGTENTFYRSLATALTQHVVSESKIYG